MYRVGIPEPTPSIMKDLTALMVGNCLAEAMMVRNLTDKCSTGRLNEGKKSKEEGEDSVATKHKSVAG